jgi:hypothetical protein
MKYYNERINEICFFILVILALISVGAALANADCHVVWKPGMTIFAQPGHPVRYTVESEDMEAFSKRKSITPPKLTPFPSAKGPQEAIDKTSSAFCGDYVDVQDKDVYDDLGSFNANDHN